MLATGCDIQAMIIIIDIGVLYIHIMYQGSRLCIYIGEGVGFLPFLGLVIVYSWSSGIRCGTHLHLEPLDRDTLGTIIIKGWSFFRC